MTAIETALANPVTDYRRGGILANKAAADIGVHSCYFSHASCKHRWMTTFLLSRIVPEELNERIYPDPSPTTRGR